jgi:hypothetical protein
VYYGGCILIPMRSVGCWLFVGRWVGQSIGRPVGWLVGRSVGRLVSWSLGWLVGRSVGRSVVSSELRKSVTAINEIKN